jgi:lysophospholipase L1-like esterase
MEATIGQGRPPAGRGCVRRLGALAILTVLACASTACGSSPASKSATSTAAQSHSLSIVALGDSVPRGTNCDCRPYPSLSADGLTGTTGQTVTATNDSVAGYTTSGVLKQLESDSAVIDHVRKARAVEIEIGANDVAYSKQCGTSVDCYAPLVPPVEKNLAAIVKRVRELSSGNKALVVLLDYWSIWLGGKYAAEKGDAYVNAAEEMTDRVNTVIKSTASESGSAYVDLRQAFKGPSYAYDETHYLSNDGDHPNAAGHQQIAAATEAVIEKALHP